MTWIPWQLMGWRGSSEPPRLSGQSPGMVGGVDDTRQRIETMPGPQGTTSEPSVAMPRAEQSVARAPASAQQGKRLGPTGRSMRDVQDHYTRKRGSNDKNQAQRRSPSLAQKRIDSPGKPPIVKNSHGKDEQFHAAQTPEDRIAQLEKELNDLTIASRSKENGLHAELEAEKARSAALQQSTKRVEDEAKRLQAAYRTLGEREAAARTRGDELLRTLSEANQQLATTAAELANLRAFTAGDDSDIQALLALFDDINDAVADLSFRIISSLRIGDGIFRQAQLTALQRQDEDMHDFVGDFLGQCIAKSCPIEDALVPVAQAIFHKILQGMIFSSFMPIENEDSGHESAWLLGVLELLRQREPQQHCGRWRAMAYNALKQRRDDRSLVQNVVRAMFGVLGACVSVLVPTLRVNTATVFAKHQDSAVQMVMTALKWQDRARGLHCAFDYAPFFPAPGGRFTEGEMAPQELPPVTAARGEFVMLPISMGLAASRTESSGQSNVTQTRKVLKKAHVLLV